jgi:hypothetical protein
MTDQGNEPLADAARRADAWGASRERPRLQIKTAAEFDEEPISWLWKPRIPFGMLTGLDGDPDMAKSTLLLDVAARVTTGVPFPGDFDARDPANVLIISAEDSVGQVVRPRLRIAGADLDRVKIITRPRNDAGQIVPLTIPEDLDLIESAVDEHNVRLVVIDPIAAYWGESVRTHNDASVRKALAPLKEVAESTGAAIVFIRHLNKTGDAKGIYRGGGSIAIGAAARSVLLAGPHPDNADDGERVLVRIKNNLAEPFDAWVYRSVAVDDPLHLGITQPRLEWLRTERLSPEDVLLADSDARRGAPARREAEVALREVLADGPLTVNEIKKSMTAGGHSWDTVKRASFNIGVVKTPEREPGKPGIRSWTWKLPETGGVFDWNELLRRAGIVPLEPRD